MTSATYAPLPFGTGDERVNGITVQPTAGEGSPITLEVGCYIDGHYGQHAAYPHDPGTLYDCDACESACYCDDLGSQCVHCAIVEECEIK